MNCRTEDIEAKQRAHYDRIAERYEQHYFDEWSQRYRDKFFNAEITRGIELRGKRVLEAMCGSGQMTEYLSSRGAQVVGLDISAELIESFRAQHPTSDAVCRSIFDSGFDDASFDAVFVVGGLHHLHPHVDDAVKEIARVLRPGGHFCFIEPHAGSLPDLARKMIYRVDPLFEDNEASVDLDALCAAHQERFDLCRKFFGGNIGYLLVLNSLIFRIPLGLKRFYSPLLLRIEALLANLQGPLLSCFSVTQLQRR